MDYLRKLILSHPFKGVRVTDPNSPEAKFFREEALWLRERARTEIFSVATPALFDGLIALVTYMLAYTSSVPDWYKGPWVIGTPPPASSPRLMERVHITYDHATYLNGNGEVIDYTKLREDAVVLFLSRCPAMEQDERLCGSTLTVFSDSDKVSVQTHASEWWDDLESEGRLQGAAVNDINDLINVVLGQLQHNHLELFPVTSFVLRFMSEISRDTAHHGLRANEGQTLILINKGY